MLKRLLFSLILLLAVGVPVRVCAQIETITIDGIVDLINSGFSDEEIVEYIKNVSNTDIKMDISIMKRLKAKGAGPELLKYLQGLAKRDHGMEGLYWFNADKPKKLTYTLVQADAKNGNGGGYASSGRLRSLLASDDLKSDKMFLPGRTGKVVLTGEAGVFPTFRFCLPRYDKEDGENRPDSWYALWLSSIQNPSEFMCVKLKPQKDKRSFPGGMKWSGSGYQKGGDKNIIPFEVTAVNNLIYDVTFPDGLAPGEYCFIYKDLSNEWYGPHICVFDFTVQ